MSEDNPFRVFVAHTFTEHTDYLRVFEYLESRDNFFYVNVSNPSAKPVGPDSEALKEELRKQINLAEILILPIAIFAKDPVLITFQMDAAKGMGKPVLGIKAFGDTIEMPKSVIKTADDIVEWNDRTIVDAIRRLARNENTLTYETIEFKLD